jgi:hypothetical protein
MPTDVCDEAVRSLVLNDALLCCVADYDRVQREFANDAVAIEALERSVDAAESQLLRAERFTAAVHERKAPLASGSIDTTNMASILAASHTVVDDDDARARRVRAVMDAPRLTDCGATRDALRAKLCAFEANSCVQRLAVLERVKSELAGRVPLPMSSVLLGPTASRAVRSGCVTTESFQTILAHSLLEFANCVEPIAAGIARPCDGAIGDHEQWCYAKVLSPNDARQSLGNDTDFAVALLDAMSDDSHRDVFSRCSSSSRLPRVVSVVAPPAPLARTLRRDVPIGHLLPPAQHINVPRLSCSNAVEFMALEALSVVHERATGAAMSCDTSDVRAVASHHSDSRLWAPMRRQV